MKTKLKKLGQTNFIGSPEALKVNAKKKVKAYKKELANFKAKKKAVKLNYLK